MNSRDRSRLTGLSRRAFLGWASTAAVGLWIPSARAAPPKRRFRAVDPALLSPFEREHVPVLRLPSTTTNAAKVPIVVEMTHPMDPDHYITSVHVANERDPIPSKGTFYFTPANGRVYLAFQARMDHGVSEVSATAVCNRHGTWSSSRAIEVRELDGAGGCAGTAPTIGRTIGDDVHPPEIRIPELVQRGRIAADEIIHAQVKMRHPNLTGQPLDGRLVPVSEQLRLEKMEVFYGRDRVSRFAMTSALSDDPFITFSLLARREGTLGIVLVNNRGQRFEATHEIRFS
jgi:sulfur-oxidizing protein SoxY